MPAPLLQVENLKLLVRAGRGAPRAVFDSVSFSMAASESVAVLAPAGSGKARLVRTVALIQKPAAGRVLFAGRDVARAWGGGLRRLRRDLQYVGGDPRRALPPRLSLHEILAEPLQVHGQGRAAEQRARVAAAAEAWQLNPLLLTVRMSAISASLCQRVAVARACILQPRLLVCAGLTEHLEPAAGRPLLSLVSRACRAAGTAWLWTTTDPAMAAEFADRVLVLEGGQLRPA